MAKYDPDGRIDGLPSFLSVFLENHPDTSYNETSEFTEEIIKELYNFHLHNTQTIH